MSVLTRRAGRFCIAGTEADLLICGCWIAEGSSPAGVCERGALCVALEEVINEGNKAGIRSALAQQERLWGEGQAGREVCLELYLPINIKLMSSLFLKEKKASLVSSFQETRLLALGSPFFVSPC